MQGRINLVRLVIEKPRIVLTEMYRALATAHILSFAVSVFDLTINNAGVTGNAVTMMLLPGGVGIATIFGSLVHALAQVCFLFIRWFFVMI